MRRTTAALLTAVLALVPTTAGCSLQTLGSPKGDFTLHAVFDDVQTLVKGHSVQLADVAIGTVTDVRLQGWRTRVTMSILDERRIPEGTTATIAKTSLLGENYVHLTPPSPTAMRAGPFLATRATLQQTSIRPDLESVAERVGPVLAAAAGEDLNAIVSTLSTSTRDRGPQLNRIVTRATELSNSYAAAADDLGKVLDGLGRLSGSLAKGSREIDRLPGTILEATKRVERDRKDLKNALEQLVRMSEQFNGRVQKRHAPRMRALLVRIDKVMASMYRGRDQLKTLLDVTDTQFFNAPSMAHDGQAIAHAWIAGFLPPPQNAGAKQRDPITEIQRLLAPKGP